MTYMNNLFRWLFTQIAVRRFYPGNILQMLAAYLLFGIYVVYA